MFIPAALRYGNGTDYFSYVYIFNNIQNKNTELGYKLLNQLIQYLELDVQFVFATMSFLTLYFLFKAVPYRSFYFIVPFYFASLYAFSYNGVRQALVVTMAYYAYQLMGKKRIILSLFYILIASFFHTSAFLYYIIFLIMMIFKIQKKHAIFFFVILLVGSQFTNHIVDSLFNGVISYTNYAGYSSHPLYSKATERHTWYGIFSRYIIFCILLFFCPAVKSKNASNIFILFLFFIFSDILASTVIIFTRLATGFSFAWFPMIHYINMYHTKYRKIVLLILYFWSLFLLFYMIKNGTNDIAPYRTVFQR
jgi:hypothetical protein